MKKKYFPTLFALIFLVLFFTTDMVSAQSLETAHYTFKIQNSRVFVDFKLVFQNVENINLVLDLPDDSYNIKIFLDNLSGKVSFIDESAKKIKIKKTIKELELSYVSRELLKDKLFITTVKIPYNCTTFESRVILSQEYLLEKPFRGEDFETASIYPRPDRVESDGQNLIFIWHLDSVKAGETFQLVLLIKKRVPFLIYLLIISLVSLVVSLYLYSKKKHPIIIRKVDKVTSHLKEDEEQIINVLKKRGGVCEQGTLRVITGMSKSNLSRIIKELEERRIIKKIKKGKRNIISLK